MLSTKDVYSICYSWQDLVRRRSILCPRKKRKCRTLRGKRGRWRRRWRRPKKRQPRRAVSLLKACTLGVMCVLQYCQSHPFRTVKMCKNHIYVLTREYRLGTIQSNTYRQYLSIPTPSPFNSLNLHRKYSTPCSHLEDHAGCTSLNEHDDWSFRAGIVCLYSYLYVFPFSF